MPFLLALALAANTGSAATLVGNPQNMIVGVDAAHDAHSHLTFARYAALATPVALVGLAMSYVALVLLYRKDLAADGAEPGAQPERDAKADVWLTRATVGSLFLTGALLLANQPLALAALVGAGVLLAISNRDPRVFYPHIDVGLLVLFGGLFVVTKGAESSHVIDAIAARFAPDAASSFPRQAASMTVFTTVGSQMVSNVPFVLATTPWLGKLAAPDAHRTLLALVSTFAGNLTLLGSVANLIVAGAAKDDEPMSFFEHLRVGLPVTLLQVAASLAAVVIFVEAGWLR
jgi:Na+/H+ antiporter NhaD/arsenite permease-like protein